MKELFFSMNAILPVFLLIGTGYLLARIKIFTKPFLEQANNVCFTVFLPVLIFYNICSSDFAAAFDIKAILYGVGGTVILFGLLCLFVPLFIKENPRRGVMIQAMFRSNYILLGIPVCGRLAGEAGMQAAAVMAAFLIPLYNLLATIVLAHYSFSEAPKAGEVAKKVLLNPLIIGSALGFVAVLTGFRLPQALDSAVADISAIASPLALLVLGGGFTFGAVPKNLKYILGATLGKLVVFPAALLALAAALGFHGAAFAVLICAFSSPVAVSSFVMAVRENGDGELAGQIVVVTTAASLLTMLGIVYASRRLGLL